MDDVEQYSAESAAQLDAAAADVIEAIRRYTESVRGMRGGSSEAADLFAHSAALERAVDLFSDRAFDHTGAWPFVVHLEDEDDDEEEDGPRLGTGTQISVVSRWDLEVFDDAALVAAGRAAHREVWPEETAEDAEAAVPDVPRALYAVTHAAGEPWFEIPGVGVLGGARAYLVPDEPLTELPDDPDDVLLAVAPPQGRVVYGEGWQ